MRDTRDLSDKELIARLEKAAFSYFAENADAHTGLIADTSREGSPCSVAVVGFALSCFPAAVAHGWLTRERAAAWTCKILDFFESSEQSDDPSATGYKGFYYHFLDMRTGKRVWNCELSLIDTALLIAGVLVAAAFFDSDDSGETRIRQTADRLYRRIVWSWAQPGDGTFAQGWKPECGFLHYGWEGYNEAAILYILGLGSPTFPLAAQGYEAWRMTYQWENLLSHNVLYSGPLFTHLFSHAWIDFRGIQDRFMRQKKSDYFRNTQETIALHREYGRRNCHEFVGYSENLWGITAGDGPQLGEMRAHGRDRRFFGYMARGVPYGPDDGTIAPWAMLATLPFGEAAALAGTRHLLKRYPQVCRDGKFSSGFNPTLVIDGQGWLSEGWYGLDQGLLLMMIENHLNESIWRLTRRSPYFIAGLRRAGFAGGWLGDDG
ncbi:MAG: hypothetical protein JSR60_20635 [Proteobacteria bacterium]|nr:hypothetical protein [Pseudomonadota bacterium]